MSVTIINEHSSNNNEVITVHYCEVMLCSIFLDTYSCPAGRQLTCWGCDCKPAMQTEWILCHKKCDARNQSKCSVQKWKTRSALRVILDCYLISVHRDWQQSKWLQASVSTIRTDRQTMFKSCREIDGKKRGWGHEEQESKSVRAQQVPAPCFYKLHLIGHLVFSTQCDTQSPSPPTQLPWSYVVLRRAAVTG